MQPTPVHLPGINAQCLSDPIRSMELHFIFAAKAEASLFWPIRLIQDAVAG